MGRVITKTNITQCVSVQQSTAALRDDWVFFCKYLPASLKWLRHDSHQPTARERGQNNTLISTSAKFWFCFVVKYLITEYIIFWNIYANNDVIALHYRSRICLWISAVYKPSAVPCSLYLSGPKVSILWEIDQCHCYWWPGSLSFQPISS